MPTDSGSYNRFVTKIPTLDDNANIQTALKVFLYGSATQADASDDTLTATDPDISTNGLVGHLQNLEDNIVISTPPGVINMYVAGAAPTGWLLCDGSAVSRSTYSDLFSVIGTGYGTGDGSTTFNIPDIRGRVPVGLHSGYTEFDALNDQNSMDTRTHTLSYLQIPSHTHSGTTGTDWPDHQHNDHRNQMYGGNVQLGGGGLPQWGKDEYNAGSGGAHSRHQHSFTTDGGTGGNQAHNNLQPYVVVNYIIKT